MKRVRKPTGCAAFILAGGRSRRMGVPKALIKWRGKTWLRHSVEALRSMAFPQPRIIRKDIVPGAGPLGGIYTALCDCREPWAFFIPCDMPGLNQAQEALNWWLTEAFKLADANGERVQIVFTQSRKNDPPEFQCAGFPIMMRTSIHALLLQMIQSEKKSLQKLVAESESLPLKLPEKWRSHFNNLNTPEEWDWFNAM